MKLFKRKRKATPHNLYQFDKNEVNDQEASRLIELHKQGYCIISIN